MRKKSSTESRPRQDAQEESSISIKFADARGVGVGNVIAPSLARVEEGATTLQQSFDSFDHVSVQVLSRARLVFHH